MVSVSAEVSKTQLSYKRVTNKPKAPPTRNQQAKRAAPRISMILAPQPLLAAATARARARACVCSLRVELAHYMERVTTTEPTAADRGAGVAATCDARPALRFYQQDWQCSASVVAPWPGYSPF